eukprot:gene37651-21395_t
MVMVGAGGMAGYTDNGVMIDPHSGSLWKQRLEELRGRNAALRRQLFGPEMGDLGHDELGERIRWQQTMLQELITMVDLTVDDQTLRFDSIMQEMTAADRDYRAKFPPDTPLFKEGWREDEA